MELSSDVVVDSVTSAVLRMDVVEGRVVSLGVGRDVVNAVIGVVADVVRVVSDGV